MHRGNTATSKLNVSGEATTDPKTGRRCYCTGL